MPTRTVEATEYIDRSRGCLVSMGSTGSNQAISYVLNRTYSSKTTPYDLSLLLITPYGAFLLESAPFNCYELTAVIVVAIDVGAVLPCFPFFFGRSTDAIGTALPL